MVRTADEPKKQPGMAKRGELRQQERIAQQAEALRANLQRRKSQLRARRDEAAIEAGVDQDESPTQAPHDQR
jgi:hypothetical protein